MASSIFTLLLFIHSSQKMVFSVLAEVVVVAPRPAGQHVRQHLRLIHGKEKGEEEGGDEGKKLDWPLSLLSTLDEEEKDMVLESLNDLLNHAETLSVLRGGK